MYNHVHTLNNTSVRSVQYHNKYNVCTVAYRLYGYSNKCGQIKEQPYSRYLHVLVKTDCIFFLQGQSGNWGQTN